MSDELRAAERVFGGPSGYSTDGFIPRQLHPDLVSDMELVCRAYISEHSDDDEPVTERWLDSVGANLQYDMMSGWHVRVSRGACHAEMTTVQVPTRRQVRDLLNVLKGGDAE